MQYNLTEFVDAPHVPFDLDGRILFHSEKFEVIHLTLKPGESVPLHLQPFDVVFYVQDEGGELTLGAEGSTESMTTLHPASGSTITVFGSVQRGWRNLGDGDLRLLVMKLMK